MPSPAHLVCHPLCFVNHFSVLYVLHLDFLPCLASSRPEELCRKRLAIYNILQLVTVNCQISSYPYFKMTPATCHGSWLAQGKPRIHVVWCCSLNAATWFLPNVVVAVGWRSYGDSDLGRLVLYLNMFKLKKTKPRMTF